mgnify:FL=1
MNDLMFSLNATVPIFLLMLLGLFFNKVGIMEEDFANKINSFVFKGPLPVMLFLDLSTVNIQEAWDTKFVVFCFVVTITSIAIAAFVAMLWKDKTIRGEYIQGSYRSSAALLGIAFIQNIYGTSGMGPLMIIGSVPLYNIVAVAALTIFRPGGGSLDRKTLKKTLIGVVKNPIILGIFAGLVWSLLSLPMPEILFKTASKFGNTATPLGLMAMGAAFDIKKAFSEVKPAIAAAFTKLIGYCVLFLPAAAWLGFRNAEMIAILVMLGSPTTVTSYVMAKNMGYEGVLSSSVVMLTTLFSAFTLTGWLYVLKASGLV